MSAKSARRAVVVDTSLFVNPDTRDSLGATPTEAFGNFLSLARQAHGLEFYMPPSIFEELMNFVSRETLPAELLHYLIQKAPSRYEVQMPAGVLYELVEDIRERVNKGLRIAEKAARSAERDGVDAVIKDMRRKYRDALREGIIDSKEDVDLILLARELGAVLVTADQGAITWAEKLGVRWLFPEKFRAFVEADINNPQSKEG